MLEFLFPSSQISSILLDDISFEIKHTKRKNMKRIVMRIERQNEIRISSATGISRKRIHAFICAQKEWILSRNRTLEQPFLQGSVLYHLGQEHIIEYHNGDFQLHEGHVFINPVNAKKHSDDFYKSSARRYLPERIEYWREKMGLCFSGLNFRLAKRRWGSCTAKGVITLNPYVMKLTPTMIDYVIVHELAHLRHLNHSKDFYALVEEFVPDYKEVQMQINEFSLKIIN